MLIRRAGQRNILAEPLPRIAKLNLHDAAGFIEVKHDAMTDIFLFGGRRIGERK